MSPEAPNVLLNEAVAQRSKADLPRWARALRAVYRVNFLVMIVGLFGALAHQRFAAFLLVAYLVGQMAFHVGIGLYGYRESMGRQWPAVPSLPEDDDDW
jgi:ABC-type microcin C transport system permease subunit YejB